jgi:hypothetical protein
LGLSFRLLSLHTVHTVHTGHTVHTVHTVQDAQCVNAALTAKPLNRHAGAGRQGAGRRGVVISPRGATIAHDDSRVAVAGFREAGETQSAVDPTQCTARNTEHAVREDDAIYLRLQSAVDTTQCTARNTEHTVREDDPISLRFQSAVDPTQCTARNTEHTIREDDAIYMRFQSGRYYTVHLALNT